MVAVAVEGHLFLKKAGDPKRLQGFKRGYKGIQGVLMGEYRRHLGPLGSKGKNEIVEILIGEFRGTIFWQLLPGPMEQRSRV